MTILCYEHRKKTQIDLFFIFTMSDFRTLSHTNAECKFCNKGQPMLNLFCINCNKRDWN